MATVYLARTRLVADTFRSAALKILHQKLAADDGAGLADLIAEAKLASAIRHPNVVPVLSVEEDPPWVALVMEYVEGETISGLVRAARAKGEKLPARVAGAVLADVLAGLHAAHEASDDGRPLNLVHRDVSPQNVLVGLDGRARLTDFGIAKVERTNATATGLVKGKTGYMAPEQIAGLELDRAVDVWAAAVVTWELVAGERLYNGEPMPTMLRIVNEVAPRLRAAHPEVPIALDEVVASALAHDPKKRPPTADAFRRALVDAWAEYGGLADPDEVGSYVRSLAGEKLERRREQVAEIVSLRARMSSVTRTAEVSARETSSSKEPPVEVAALAASSPASAVEVGVRSPSARRRTLLAITAGALAAVTIPAVWYSARSDATPSAPAAPASATTMAGTESRVVVFGSKKPITAVRVAGREVTTHPTETLGVPVPDGEHQAVVVAADGETKSVVVGSTATQIAVPFDEPVAPSSATSTSSASAPPSPARPPIRGSAPAKSGKDPKDPGLADTPY